MFKFFKCYLEECGRCRVCVEEYVILFREFFERFIVGVEVYRWNADLLGGWSEDRYGEVKYIKVNKAVYMVYIRDRVKWNN